MKFKRWQIGEGMYAIQCPGYLPGPGRLPGWGYVISFLIIGENKAIVFDTGYGNADLKSFIESITALPLMVFNSHVHPDHSGGNQQFGTIYVLEDEVNSKDPIYFPQKGELDRCDLVKNSGDYHFEFLQDQQIIDLGNRKVQVFKLEGHTKGSMALIDDLTHIMLSGDAILKRVLMLAHLPLSTYQKALERMINIGGYEEIWGSHWYEPLGKDYIEKMLDLIKDFNLEKVEKCPWNTGEMGVFIHGNSQEDHDFVAIGYNTKDEALMLM